MNNDQVKILLTETENYLSSVFIPELEKYQKRTVDFISYYISNYKTWKEEVSTIEKIPDKFNLTAVLHRKFEENLHKHHKFIVENNSINRYSGLENFIKEKSTELDLTLTLEQEPHHFIYTENDTRIIKIKKNIKSTSFSVSKKLHKIFKKNDDYNWKRIIPLKNLWEHHFMHNYLNRLLKEIESYIEASGSSLINLLNQQWLTDTIFINHHFPYTNELKDSNFEKSFVDLITLAGNVQIDLEDKFNQLKVSLSGLLNKSVGEFESDYSVAGTLELPTNKFNSNKIAKELSTQHSKYEKSQSNYNIYSLAIIDRIEFYEDLLWFSCLMVSNSFNPVNYSDQFLTRNFIPGSERITNEIKSTIKNITTAQNISTALLDEEKEKLKLILDQDLIPPLLQRVSSVRINNVLKEYTKKLNNNLNEFEKEYTFVQPKNLTYRIRKDQCKIFSPKEIISPIVIQKISNSIDGITENFNNSISKTNPTIISLARIVEFNLESSKIKLSEEGSIEDSLSIANEGLDRAINKTEDYHEAIVQSFINVNKRLNTVVVELLDDLLSLFNIEKLITIKIQVSKEKAIREIKNNLTAYYEKISNWFLFLKTKVIELFSWIRGKILGISSKVGLGETSVEISEAMADYLVRVSQSLEKLPYVYQRLFSNDQLSDERIFIGRREEVLKLEKGITYWQNNQISSIMLVGEKGSGTSSLLNITLKKFDLHNKVYRKHFTRTIYKEEQLVDLFREVLGKDDLNSFDELKQTLKNFNERKVIVIENLEDFFLRIVDGFEAVYKLMELITSTNSKILWIATCNTHAWEYLKRVMNINDFFIFNIRLKELDDNQIENIIMSRHNISGYDLEFLPNEDIKKQKSFNKLSENEKQDFLKKVYFEQLNELTANNISVALFLWLRSISNSDEEKIQVSTGIELDFNFLNSLSDRKLFTLMAIILHDGLTPKEHCLIFNTSVESTQLLFATLADDGIIFKRGEHYKINFQLYKPIINLLKNKNILH